MRSTRTGAPPAPGDHGGDAEAVADHLGVDPADVLDLSASLNPVAPNVGAALLADLDRIRRYPDAGRATEALATAIGTEPERLVLTNGGAEAIALVAALEPEGWVEEPDFSLYRRHLRRLDPGAPRWRSNPSNPFGRLAAPAERARVWDEAFWPLATGTWTRGDPGCWRLGSLTKLWSCPGLRIGYAIAPDEASADAMRALQPRWAVNGLAAAAVERLLPMTDLPTWRDAIAARRSHLVEELGDRGLAVTDTEACWVLVEHPDLRSRLVPFGVVVRDCTSFGLPSLTRIAVPDGRGLDRLLDALDRVLP